LFSDSVHGIPGPGVCRLASLPDKVLREKEIPWDAKLYDRFISDLELKGYTKKSINSYVKLAMVAEVNLLI